MSSHSTRLATFFQSHAKKLKILSIVLVILRITPLSWSNALRQIIATSLRTIASVIDISYILPIPTLVKPAFEAKQLARVSFIEPFNSRVAEDVNLEQTKRLVSPHAPHRHSNAINSALKLSSSLTDLSAWTHSSTNNQVSIYTKQTDRIPLPFVRGRASLPGFTVNEWVSVIRSSAARCEWDDRFVSTTVVERFNQSESLSVSVQKGSFPVAAREFLIAQCLIRDSAAKTYILTTSVVDASAPDASADRVRADLVLGVWILEEVDGCVLVDYIVGLDFKGTVPEYLVKRVQSATPMCIMSVFKFLSSKGSVPFVLVQDVAFPDLTLSSDVVAQNEVYDSKSGEFKVDFKIKRGGVQLDRRGQVTIILSKAYAGGVEIKAVSRGPLDISINGRVLTDAKICSGRIVQIWIDEGDVVEEEFRFEIIPSQSGTCMLNGAVLE